MSNSSPQSPFRGLEVCSFQSGHTLGLWHVPSSLCQICMTSIARISATSFILLIIGCWHAHSPPSLIDLSFKLHQLFLYCKAFMQFIIGIFFYSQYRLFGWFLIFVFVSMLLIGKVCFSFNFFLLFCILLIVKCHLLANFVYVVD